LVEVVEVFLESQIFRSVETHDIVPRGHHHAAIAGDLSLRRSWQNDFAGVRDHIESLVKKDVCETFCTVA